jgi:hypothetical protein
MRRVVLLALLAIGTGVLAQRISRLVPRPLTTIAPNVPAIDPNPAFPLRVHLLTARWGGIASIYHGYGSGNLLDGSGPRGFDYGFECDVPFVANQGEDTYQARWKGSPYQLEILMVEVGAARPHTHTCALQLAARRQPFEPENTASLPHGVSSSLSKRWRDPDFAYEEPAPDYAVRFHVVDGLRDEDGSGDHGWGTANISEPGAGGKVEGAQYRYDCWYGFLTNSQLNGFYQGHWVTPGRKLQVLLQRPGSDKVDKCTVVVNVQAQPYPESRHIHVQTQAASSVGPGGQAAGTP